MDAALDGRNIVDALRAVNWGLVWESIRIPVDIATGVGTLGLAFLAYRQYVENKADQRTRTLSRIATTFYYPLRDALKEDDGENRAGMFPPWKVVEVWENLVAVNPDHERDHLPVALRRELDALVRTAHSFGEHTEKLEPRGREALVAAITALAPQRTSRAASLDFVIRRGDSWTSERLTPGKMILWERDLGKEQALARQRWGDDDCHADFYDPADERHVLHENPNIVLAVWTRVADQLRADGDYQAVATKRDEMRFLRGSVSRRIERDLGGMRKHLARPVL